jgi:FkbM family methyltransferase
MEHTKMPSPRLKDFLSPTQVVDRMIGLAFRLGATKFAEALHYHLKSSATGQLIRAQVNGIELWLNPLNYVDRIFLFGEQHDPEVSECLSEVLRENDVFWDVGANFGYFSFLATQLAAGVKVYAFEPSPVTYMQLFANNILHHSRISTLPFGLAEHSGLARISLKVTRNTGQSTFRRNPAFAYDCDAPTYCVSGDDAIRQGLAAFPQVMKIDVEGFEAEVLRGMRSSLVDSRLRAIIVEVLDSDAMEVFAFLADHGFTGRRLLAAVGGNYLLQRGS